MLFILVREAAVIKLPTKIELLLVAAVITAPDLETVNTVQTLATSYIIEELVAGYTVHTVHTVEFSIVYVTSNR